eukprot:Hpha_TRINITY_DN15109_c1_g3::TRINITY_DN15109_c1_g3_i1::g.130200::m.130200
MMHVRGGGGLMVDDGDALMVDGDEEEEHKGPPGFPPRAKRRRVAGGVESLGCGVCLSLCVEPDLLDLITACWTADPATRPPSKAVDCLGTVHITVHRFRDLPVRLALWPWTTAAELFAKLGATIGVAAQDLTCYYGWAYDSQRPVMKLPRSQSPLKDFGVRDGGELRVWVNDHAPSLRQVLLRAVGYPLGTFEVDLNTSVKDFREVAAFVMSIPPPDTVLTFHSRVLENDNTSGRRTLRDYGVDKESTIYVFRRGAFGVIGHLVRAVSPRG